MIKAGLTALLAAFLLTVAVGGGAAFAQTTSVSPSPTGMQNSNNTSNQTPSAAPSTGMGGAVR